MHAVWGGAVTRAELVALEERLCRLKVAAQTREEEANQVLRKAHQNREALGAEVREAIDVWLAVRNELHRLDQQKGAT
jgi:hypothetical protein